MASPYTGPPVVITVAEAARRLGIGRNQAYAAAHRGEIPSVRFGKRIVVPIAAFEKLMAGEKRSHQERSIDEA